MPVTLSPASEVFIYKVRQEEIDIGTLTPIQPQSFYYRTSCNNKLTHLLCKAPDKQRGPAMRAMCAMHSELGYRSTQDRGLACHFVPPLTI